MKILKPGKAEQRKFVCPKCGCIFVANTGDAEFLTTKNSPYVFCPTCNVSQSWYDGEPYEEPTQDGLERLTELISETPDVRVWPDAGAKIAKYLIANGVTFREV